LSISWNGYRKTVNIFFDTSILDAHTFNIIVNPTDIDNIIERVLPAIDESLRTLFLYISFNSDTFDCIEVHKGGVDQGLLKPLKVQAELLRPRAFGNHWKDKIISGLFLHNNGPLHWYELYQNQHNYKT